MQAAGADVFAGGVHVGGDGGDLFDGVFGELQVDVVHPQQLAVLSGDGVARLGEDLDEVLFGKALQLYVDGEAPLQFGDEVFHLRHMEGACGDKEDEVRLHGAVLGHHRAALDDGQDIPLHPLARDVCPALVGFAGDLVDLVDEDDALFFGTGEAFGVDGVVVDEFFRLFVHQLLHRLFDGHLAALFALGQHVAEDGADVDLRPAGHDLHALGCVGDLDLDLGIVELARAQLFDELGVEHVLRQFAALALFHLRKHVYDFLFRRRARLDGHLFHLFFFDKADGTLHEVAHHALHVSADVADLGVLGRLYLDEGRLDQLCQAAGDLRFADARRALHDDVFGRDLLAVRLRKAAAAVAVAQRDRHRALGFVLPDDIFIQFVYDLFG